MYANWKGMWLEQKSYEKTSAIAKSRTLISLVAGAQITAITVCGIKYTDRKVSPYYPERTEGPLIPRYFSADGCKAHEKVPFLRRGELWSDRIGVITV